LAIPLPQWSALRRLIDVLLTLTPLLVAAIVTLELCSAFKIPLTFANITALPALLAVGVAFKICYIMVWRSGRTAAFPAFTDGARIRAAAAGSGCFEAAEGRGS
jgi:uncharacterized protein